MSFSKSKILFEMGSQVNHFKNKIPVGTIFRVSNHIMRGYGYFGIMFGSSMFVSNNLVHYKCRKDYYKINEIEKSYFTNLCFFVGYECAISVFSFICLSSWPFVLADLMWRRDEKYNFCGYSHLVPLSDSHRYIKIEIGRKGFFRYLFDQK